MADASHSRRLQRNAQDVERRKRLVGIEADDLVKIAAIKPIVVQNVEQFSAAFFNHLRKADAAGPLLRNATLFAEATQLKREHIIAMASGDYGLAYVEQRIRLGNLYSKVGLDVQVFLGAFHQLLNAIGAEIMKRNAANPVVAFESFASLNKIGFLDLGVIVDVLIDERERTISEQQDAIREISTPVLQVRDRLLILPIIGLIDSQRAKQLTDNLLHAIRANRARVVVMDITGVAAVDSKVANHLIQTVAAARLMGAAAIVTGLSADVAQSLVALGVDLSKINTVGDLQGGLEAAERLLGYKITPLEQPAALRA
jgi:rsbT co-antagonist protein RsbR